MKAFILFLTSLVSLSFNPACAQSYYLLMCKTSPAVLLEMKNIAGNGTDIATHLIIRFKKSKYSGASGKLKSGECAFIDRALKSDESACMSYAMKENSGLPWTLFSKLNLNSDGTVSGKDTFTFKVREIENYRLLNKSYGKYYTTLVKNVGSSYCLSMQGRDGFPIIGI